MKQYLYFIWQVDSTDYTSKWFNFRLEDVIYERGNDGFSFINAIDGTFINWRLITQFRLHEVKEVT